ncbi:MAG: ferredoxin family protein [Desulfatibacillaceae bacterium]
MTLWRVPLDAETITVIRGDVHIIEDRCKGCGYCIEYCPNRVLEFSKKFNQKGYHPPFANKPDMCVNCHYCEIICPEFAIYSVEASGQTSPAQT